MPGEHPGAAVVITSKGFRRPKDDGGGEGGRRREEVDHQPPRYRLERGDVAVAAVVVAAVAAAVGVVGVHDPAWRRGGVGRHGSRAGADAADITARCQLGPKPGEE